MSAATLAPILRFVLEQRGWPVPARLEAMAGRLPPVACAGLEVPLLGTGPWDLQQRLRTVREVHLLERAIRNPSWPEWPGLEFCAQELRDGRVEDLWLELDADDTAPDPPVSLFTRLPEPLGEGEAWRILDRAAAPERREAVARCLGALPSGARLSHLGLMLGRPRAPLRLIVEGVPLAEVTPFLCRAGWQGDAPALGDQIETLAPWLDRIRLALTVESTLLPTIGLECFLGPAGSRDPRWRLMFDWLVGAGLGDPGICGRALAWQGSLTPASATQAWPYPLMLEALVRGPRYSGWLDCRISHVKLTHREGRLTQAKAYIGFLAQWDDLAPPPAPAAATRLPEAARSRPGAVQAALGFLLAARTPTGWWLDFDGFQEGVSDEWVTAYVGHALAESRSPDAQAAAVRAWSLLARRGRAGWGWNGLQPADADSTLWALRLADRLGVRGDPAAERAQAFLGPHIQADGGVVTYLRTAHQGAPAPIHPDWYSPHLCVTSALAGMGSLADGTLDFLRRHQDPDGCWPGYWWESPCYATAHAVEAFTAQGTPGDRNRLAGAVRWATQWLDACGPDPLEAPFEVALVLRVLLGGPDPDRPLIRALAHRLIASQAADGSWRSSARLRFPNGRGQPIQVVDPRRVFTTATVLRTLVRLEPFLEALP